MWQTRGLMIIMLVLVFMFDAQAEPQNYKGINFFHPPPECEMGTNFNATRLVDGKSSVFLFDYICSGRAQFWLARAVDTNGKEFPHNYEFKYMEPRRYVVEDVLMIPVLNKNEEVINGWCTRDGIEPGPAFPFAFAIGTLVRIYNDQHEVIGGKGKKLHQAWMVNFAKRRFEPISTKGIVCEYMA